MCSIPRRRFLLKIAVLLAHFALAAAQLRSQQPPADGTNIVPNPGFEMLAGAPIGWFYKGAHFGQVAKYWHSPTAASPDLYTPSVRVPVDWAEKGFGKQAPHGGKNMAGLTLYGCNNGKPHCREYVQIQLAEPLVPGQWYAVEFWASHLPKSLQINNLGAFFTLEKIERALDEPILANPQVRAERPVIGTGGRWAKVSGKFKASEESEFLLIGNFHDDAHTGTLTYRADCFPYAYYYIDDVSVRKLPPFLRAPVKPDDLTRLVPFHRGDTVQLKNIYFEFDKDELMPRSFVELAKLLKIMRQYPTLSLEIIGHTDSDGSDDYNLDLSRRRAEAVVAYLQKGKIAAARLRARGEGEGRPLASNQSAEGRAQNRRVEFVVLRE